MRLLGRSTKTGLLWLSLFVALATAARAQSPWFYLERLRDSLASAGPTAASFTQQYVPVGFSSGEEESGTLFLSLPGCLRWDYDEPYAKSFLVCDGRVHAWTADDPAGRRYRVDPEREPGLDLLRLSVDELRRRYRADGRRTDGRLRISLQPVSETSEVQSATLVLDASASRLVRLEYSDREGNLTRFEISNYRVLDGHEPFSPPADIQWRDE